MVPALVTCADYDNHKATPAWATSKLLGRYNV